MNPLADTIVVGKRILQFDCIDSTNSYLKENAQLFPNGRWPLPGSSMQERDAGEENGFPRPAWPCLCLCC